MKLLRLLLAALFIVVITASLGLILNRTLGRARVADCTEDKLYTLSDGTRGILDKLNQPIELKLYYSRMAAMEGPQQIKYWNDYYLYVRDLLREYVKLSDGKLSLEIIDPRPFTEQEEEAVEYGIKRFPLSEDEGFFFGLVARTELGKDRVIEFFEPNREAMIEYDISKVISQLMQPDKRKIGVLSSLSVMGTDMSPYMMQMMRAQGKQPEQPWALKTDLEADYELEKVDPEADALPDGLNYLMVIHPKDLPEPMLYAIDQYVMKGGRLMVFVDPHCMADQPPRDPRNRMAAMNHKSDSDLDRLLERWGVRLVDKAIAVDRKLAQKRPLQRNAPPELIMPMLQLGETGSGTMARDEIITANLHNVNVLFAGALEEVLDSGTDVTMLMQTTDVGNTWTPEGRFGIQRFFQDPGMIRREVEDGDEPVMLACLISGDLRTNFPDGPPEVEDDAEAADDEAADGEGPADEADDEADADDREPVVKQAAAGARVVVVADVDMLTDDMAYQRRFFGVAQSGDNVPLVQNALDFLGGSEDLINVRTRGDFHRPFTVIEEIRDEATAETEEEMDEIRKEIEKHKEELQALGRAANNENVRLLQNEAMKKRRELEEKVREANRRLRRLQAAERADVEAIQARFTALNIVTAPFVIAVIALALALYRWTNRRRYAAKRR